MTVKLANNVVGYLASSINASQTTLAVQTGEGAAFPSLSAGEYYYATLFSTGGSYEIVKVTARTTDTMTIVRGAEGTTPRSFASGSRVEMRVTAATVLDAASDAVEAVFLNTDISVTVGTGGDYATINEALEYLGTKFKVYDPDTITAEILLKTGFVMQEEVHLVNGQDFSWVVIRSEDAEVSIQRSSLVTSLHETYGYETFDTDGSAQLPQNTRCAFFAYNNSHLPVLGTLFSMDSSGSTSVNTIGVLLNGASSGKGLYGCGVKNVVRTAPYDGRGLNVSHNSTFSGWGTVWSGCDIGARISNASMANLRSADFSGCRIGLDVNGSAVVAAQDSDISACTQYAVYATDCQLKINNSDLTGNAPGGTPSVNYATILAVAGAVVDATGCDISGGQRGIYAEDGAQVTFTDGVADALAGWALVARTGGTIIANDATLTDSLAEGGCASYPGSRIVLTGATVTGHNNSTNGVYAIGGVIDVTDATVSGNGGGGGKKDLAVQDGGVIIANGTTTTSGSGSPDLDDTNLTAFAHYFAEGVIFGDTNGAGTISIYQLGAVGDGVTSDAAAFARAIALSYPVDIPPATYEVGASTLSCSGDVDLRGAVGAVINGTGTFLTYTGGGTLRASGISLTGFSDAFLINQGASAIDAIYLERITADLDSGTFLSQQNAGYAQTARLVVRDCTIDCNRDTTACAGISYNSPVSNVHIAGNTITAANTLGISIGTNSYTNSLSLTDIHIERNKITDIVRTGITANSTYGIITYGYRVHIHKNHVEDVDGPSGEDTEGIYIKAVQANICDNTLINAGGNEGSIVLKGNDRGSTSAPQGWQNIVSRNHIYYTDTYTHATNIRAIQVGNSYTLVSDNLVERVAGGPSSMTGLRITGNASHITVTDNQFLGMMYGINVSNNDTVSKDYLRIVGNYMTQNSDTATSPMCPLIPVDCAYLEFSRNTLIGAGVGYAVRIGASNPTTILEVEYYGHTDKLVFEGNTILGFDPASVGWVQLTGANEWTDGVDTYGPADYVKLTGNLIGTTAANAFDIDWTNVGQTQQADNLFSDGQLVGFFGATPTTKQTVTGSRGGNAALQSLLTALAAYGLVTDSSS